MFGFRRLRWLLKEPPDVQDMVRDAFVEGFGYGVQARAGHESSISAWIVSDARKRLCREMGED